jgi:Ni/Co efflux regulator RcnB
MKLLLCVALAAVVCLHAVQADAQNAQKVSEWSDKSQASAVAASSSNDVPSRQERAAKETKKEKKEKKVRGENRAWPRAPGAFCSMFRLPAYPFLSLTHRGSQFAYRLANFAKYPHVLENAPNGWVHCFAVK